jgi:glycosyltransferase involved in cell wall biosynthesis
MGEQGCSRSIYIGVNNMTIRVGIYTLVTPGPYTGVGRQLYGLLAGLQEIDQDNEYLLYANARLPLPVRAANFRPTFLPVHAQARLRNHLFTAFALPLLAARHGLDVLHIPNTMPLLYSLKPTIATIFDLTEFALPQRVYKKGQHHYRRLANRLAARRADAVITTSANTKSDLVRYLGVDPARVHVIYPGIDHDHFRPQAIGPAQRERLARAYGLPDRYLLYAGKIQPRKNLVRVLQAFHRLRPAHPDLRLVLAGARGWMDEEVDRTLEALNLAGTVHFTGPVNGDMPALYNLAEALVFPSLYEGFGFPLVEAMACGLPVVTATTSSLGEVAGDAALCVDPTSVEEIAAAVDTLLRNTDQRDRLRQQGLSRAGQFSWPQCAAETMACYLATT